MSIIALIVAVVGTVCAMIPGVLIIGWILLPVAFVLAIIGLILKGRKWAAIVALVLSIVGTIAGVIAFFIGAANVVTDAFDEIGDTTISEEVAGDDEEASAPDDDATMEDDDDAEGSDAQGTRENPLPLGSTVDSDEWSITVNSVTLGATDAVLAENQFNDPPADGDEYILVNVTATYIGADSGMPAIGTGVEYVTADGVTISGDDALAVAPDAFDSMAELYTDATVTGNFAFAVPSASAADGTLAIRAGLLADKVFFAVQ
ncbi:DUF4352 domain-containing protein [Microbacterium karelineae]|uniref:DUF4352 domain-containing protein n=1 Tax=Microbacterium karelineae TaxID=2654283 RepID=UPI001E4FCC65|nr:DUF4352 domain-containing protein [Microbacterium karelineae]